MSNGPQEPNADMRVLASTFRQMYLALVQEGFTKSEAMTLIALTIQSIIAKGGESS